MAVATSPFQPPCSLTPLSSGDWNSRQTFAVVSQLGNISQKNSGVFRKVR